MRNRKNVKARIASLILCAAMTVTSVSVDPAAVFAAQPETVIETETSSDLGIGEEELEGVTEETAEDSEKKSTEEAAEEPTEEAAEKPAEEAAKEPVGETTKEPAGEEATEDEMEELPEEITGEATEELSEETTEEFLEEITGETTEELLEETTEETTEELTEEETVKEAGRENPSAAFLVKNGNFADGLEYWTPFSMIWEGYNTNAVFTPVAGGLEVAINPAGENGQYAGLWTVSLSQMGKYRMGNTYTVEFDIVSTITRPIEYGIQERVQVDGQWTDGEIAHTQSTYLTENKVQHIEKDITIKDVRDINGDFVIRMGAPDKDVALEAHTITISNIWVGEKGAKEKYLKLMDYEFDGTNYTLQSGSTAGGENEKYVNLENGGNITYSDIEVEAGESYEVFYAARTPDTASVKAAIDGKEIGNAVLNKYTDTYSFIYEAETTGKVSLAISSEGGTTYLDNVGVWQEGAGEVLRNSFPAANINLPSLSLNAKKKKVALGKDAELELKTADGTSVSGNAVTAVKVGGKEIDASNYTATEGGLTVSGNAFTNPGDYSIEVEAEGYEKPDKLYITILTADGNVIENGNFENGMEGWTTYFNERYAGTAEITEDYWAKIHINFLLNWYIESGDDWGPVDWSTQLSQKNVGVEAGETYTLSFEAYSSVKRPIAVSVDGKKGWFLLNPTATTYTYTYEANATKNIDVTFLMGQFPESQYQNYPFTTENPESKNHDIYITDVKMVSENSADVKKTPGIVGVDNGVTYKAPVSVKVNYRGKEYNLSVTRDEQAINYKEGDAIRETGSYVVTVTDKADTSITATKSFSIDMSLLDYSKDYVVISNKSTEKVMTAGGVKDGSSVLQRSYTGDASQFFALEESKDYPGYYLIRSMSNGLVVAAPDMVNETPLQMVEENGKSSQLWEIDETVHQGFVKFVNKTTGYAINVNGASKTEGLPLNVATKTSNADEGQQSVDSQRWDIIRTIDAKEAVEGKKIDTGTVEAWKQNAVVTPVTNKLNPAGPGTVEFYPLEGANSYEIYFDGTKTYTITKEQLDKADKKDDFMVTEDGTIKLFEAWYSTDVAKHTMYIKTDTGVSTNEKTFYLSKKGVGWATLHRVEDMNLGWYYHWATDPALGTDEDLNFVPMLWGYYGDDWLNDEANKRYGTVLSFNEPDWSDQSNVPVTIQASEEWTKRYNQTYNANRERPSTVEEAWPAFMASGLRIGSPATALAPPYCDGSITMNDVDGPDRWWFDFMDLMAANEDKGWDYDFVAIHCYDAGCDAKGFLEMVDKTHELTGKPIWITEFGVAEWNENKVWRGGNSQTQKQVIDFMTEVVNGLEERDFVERYAWFPFDGNDEYGGASGIFDYETGELNALGQVYAQLGIPAGYETASYDTEVPKILNVKAGKTTLKAGETTTVSVSKGENPQWSSDNEAVATVDAAGNVQAKAAGTAKISVTTSDGYSGWIKISVVDSTSDGNDGNDGKDGNDGADGSNGANGTDGSNGANGNDGNNGQNAEITMSIAKTSILENETTQCTVLGASDITYTSDNSAVATVSATGLVKGVKAGKATISATSARLGSTASVEVTVIKPTVKWNVSYKTVPLQLKNGKKVNKTTVLQPTGLQAGDSVKSFTSSNKKIATVKNSKGKLTITPKKVGKTKITVKTKYGATAVFTLKVQKGAVKVSKLTVDNVKNKKLTLKKGKSFQLETTKKYITALDKVTFTSSNKKVATVSSKGLIKGKKKGTAKITVKCQKKKVVIKVTVK